MALIDYANPTRFIGLIDKLMPWLVGATVVLLGLGFYQVFFVAPDDY